jgi:thiopeptide-type bacteriocin biosynthesis protein
MNLFLLFTENRQKQNDSDMENRTFIPGSEWIYFKIYTGTKTADAILKNELCEYVSKMLRNNIVDKWFFIRYNDPDFHVRFRLHLRETQSVNDVFNRFFDICNPLVNSGLVWNIQCDTYQREIERYGVNSISIIEDLFFIDSEFIVKLLWLLDEENPDQHRWKLSLTLMDSFLSAFSFDLPHKKELLDTMAENYKKEFGFTHHHTKKQLDGKYRTFRKDIDNAMSWENETSKLTDIVKARRQATFSIAEKLTAMEKFGELQVPLKSLLTSIIHMTMNRWFRTKNRLHELVIYDFMSRYYSSEMIKISIKISENEISGKNNTNVDH